MLQVLGIAAAVLSLSSNIPYILDTIKGVTQPHRVSWGIFFLLNIISLANQAAAGATSSLWLIGAFTLSTLTIFSLSIKNGVGGSSKLDLIALFGSLAGVIVWQLIDSPTASIVANIIAGGIAGFPTIVKAYRKPESETKIKWFFGAIAGLLAALSVGELNVVLLLLPLDVFLYQGSIVVILILRDSKKRRSRV